MTKKLDFFISVITPVYNNLAYTRQLIDSLKRTDAGANYELIIVDNASTDGTKEYCTTKENFSGINGKYVYNKKNKGFAIANNQGIIAADKDTDYYCFLNNDTVVTGDWLGAMVRTMTRNANCVIVGSKLIRPGIGTIQHAGVIENKGKYPEHIYFDELSDFKPANEEKKYIAVTGACMLIEKDFYKMVGGFDEAYWCGWEDIDLCKKAKKLGKEIWYSPDSIVYHYEGMTEGRMVAEGENFSRYMHRWVLGVGNN